MRLPFVTRKRYDEMVIDYELRLGVSGAYLEFLAIRNRNQAEQIGALLTHVERCKFRPTLPDDSHCENAG